MIETVLWELEVALPQLGVCAAGMRCGCADRCDGPAVQCGPSTCRAGGLGGRDGGGCGVHGVGRARYRGLASRYWRHVMFSTTSAGSSEQIENPMSSTVSAVSPINRVLVTPLS